MKATRTEQTARESMGLPTALCGTCLRVIRDAYDVKKVSGGVDHKIVCARCHKKRYGAEYEIGRPKR